MTLDEAIAVHWATATQDSSEIAGSWTQTYQAAQGNLYVLLVAHLLPEHGQDAPVIAECVVFSILPETGPEPAEDLIGYAVMRLTDRRHAELEYRYESEPWSQT